MLCLLSSTTQVKAEVLQSFEMRGAATPKDPARLLSQTQKSNI